VAERWALPLLSTGTVAFAECTDDAIEHVALNLKPADREEAYATTGHRRYADALRLSVMVADSARVGFDAYGQPVAVLGVSTLSLLYNIGAPWMLTVGHHARHRRALMTLGRAYTAAMLEQYHSLENHVDARHTESVAWLQRLGYRIDPPSAWGALALPFHRFSIER
jgi:hypothetical protein